MNMRTTKVYSITMPPEMAKQAERLAKRENRTMSELGAGSPAAVSATFGGV
jgi:hypothetical protein